jgi:S-formylglutathione hydrolase FrmB
MIRAWLAAAFAVLWLAVGASAVHGYGANCHPYRGFPPPQDQDAGQLAPFAGDLRAAGAHVETRVLQGRHDWRLWRAQTPAMLGWAARATAA